MQNKNIEQGLFGETLFEEAATALLYSTEKVASDISPEEAAELEMLQRRVMDLDNSRSQSYVAASDDVLPIAADEETPYNN